VFDTCGFHPIDYFDILKSEFSSFLPKINSWEHLIDHQISHEYKTQICEKHSQGAGIHMCISTRSPGSIVFSGNGFRHHCGLC